MGVQTASGRIQHTSLELKGKIDRAFLRQIVFVIRAADELYFLLDGARRRLRADQAVNISVTCRRDIRISEALVILVIGDPGVTDSKPTVAMLDCFPRRSWRMSRIHHHTLYGRDQVAENPATEVTSGQGAHLPSRSSGKTCSDDGRACRRTLLSSCDEAGN